MIKITVVFDGGSRNNPDAGFGSFAIIKGNQSRVTRLEFGGAMTSHEAAYDTLLMALRMLLRQETPGSVALEVQTPSQLVANQLKGTWEARETRMRTRRDQACDMLRQFASYNITRASRDYTDRVMGR